MLVHHKKIKTYQSWHDKAKWELKYYWEDGVTVECRYFATMKDAEAYAEQEGYPMEDYSIVPNKY